MSYFYTKRLSTAPVTDRQVGAGSITHHLKVCCVPLMADHYELLSVSREVDAGGVRTAIILAATVAKKFFELS